MKWEPGVSMHFHGSVQEPVSPILQHLHLLIGVFFLDTRKHPTSHLKSMVRMSGDAFPQPQVGISNLITHLISWKYVQMLKVM